MESGDEIYFFTPAFHVFDSFSAHRIDIWGQSFPTAEHAYQWQKFRDYPEVKQEILASRSPEMAHRLAQKHKEKIYKEWHSEKVRIMKEIFCAKVNQNPDVMEVLKKTGDKEIIENSPVDDFWGNGPQKTGLNMIGKIWMEIRNELT
ncbi:MAG: NADAR family protein [Candidatus Nomurabacteria bacterium]|nr:MAG: NADAR family protein [Candidatus Nomurabacteria bacterium]